MIRVEPGDCMDVLPRLAAEGVRVHAVVTDPPYHLTSIVKRFGGTNAAPAKDRDGLYKRVSAGFMGKQWDGGDVAFRPETWAAVMAVMRPGAHLIAFSGTRTYHRMACAIEDAGFEVRDQIGWLFGSGFPKSHDVSKAIDRAAGEWRGRAGAPLRAGASFGQEYERVPKGDAITAATRQWPGWGTALKPAWEPCILARVPLIGTVAANVLAHGTGAINVDGCRIATDWLAERGETWLRSGNDAKSHDRPGQVPNHRPGCVADRVSSRGRWPANIIHDGSPEVMAAFAAYGESESNASAGRNGRDGGDVFSLRRARDDVRGVNDSGTAARFFYSAKADTDDRLGSKHPTVKPVDLMAYLCRLVTPPGGLVLDPFAGTGTTGAACMREGFDCILIEREAEYLADIQRRLDVAVGADTPLFQVAP